MSLTFSYVIMDHNLGPKHLFGTCLNISVIWTSNSIIIVSIQRSGFILRNISLYTLNISSLNNRMQKRILATGSDSKEFRNKSVPHYYIVL